MLIFAFGGHSTEEETKTQNAPPPWSLYVDSRQQSGWYIQKEGNSGKSGALATVVPEDWLHTLCRVRNGSIPKEPSS